MAAHPEMEFILRRQAEEVIKKLNNSNCSPFDKQEALDNLRSIPATDVSPIIHGRWAHLGGDEFCCTHCGFVISTEGSWDIPMKKYCEDCGAKMDGKQCRDN